MNEFLMLWICLLFCYIGNIVFFYINDNEHKNLKKEIEELKKELNK